jgi:hypothetical protein
MLHRRTPVGVPSAQHPRRETQMAQSYSKIVPFYAVVVKDKCKTADAETLRHYKAVAEDLLKDSDHGYADDPELKEALKTCDDAIAGYKK